MSYILPNFNSNSRLQVKPLTLVNDDSGNNSQFRIALEQKFMSQWANAKRMQTLLRQISNDMTEIMNNIISYGVTDDDFSSNVSLQQTLNNMPEDGINVIIDGKVYNLRTYLERASAYYAYGNEPFPIIYSVDGDSVTTYERMTDVLVESAAYTNRLSNILDAITTGDKALAQKAAEEAKVSVDDQLGAILYGSSNNWVERALKHIGSAFTLPDEAFSETSINASFDFSPYAGSQINVINVGVFSYAARISKGIIGLYDNFSWSSMKEFVKTTIKGAGKILKYIFQLGKNLVQKTLGAVDLIKESGKDISDRIINVPICVHDYSEGQIDNNSKAERFFNMIHDVYTRFLGTGVSSVYISAQENPLIINSLGFTFLLGGYVDDNGMNHLFINTYAQYFGSAGIPWYESIGIETDENGRTVDIWQLRAPGNKLVEENEAEGIITGYPAFDNEDDWFTFLAAYDIDNYDIEDTTLDSFRKILAFDIWLASQYMTSLSGGVALPYQYSVYSGIDTATPFDGRYATSLFESVFQDFLDQVATPGDWVKLNDALKTIDSELGQPMLSIANTNDQGYTPITLFEQLISNAQSSEVNNIFCLTEDDLNNTQFILMDVAEAAKVYKNNLLAVVAIIATTATIFVGSKFISTLRTNAIRRQLNINASSLALSNKLLSGNVLDDAEIKQYQKLLKYNRRVNTLLSPLLPSYVQSEVMNDSVLSAYNPSKVVAKINDIQHLIEG